MKKIYGVTGMPLAGKTLAADIMRRKGYTVLDMGDIVRIEMDKREIEVDETGTFVNQMREEHGMNAIAQLCRPYFEEMRQEKKKIVITGMRNIQEKKYFEKQSKTEIKIIALWASRETRRKRKEERQREEDVKGDEFKERDQREIENGVAELIALSDYLIKNDNDQKNQLENQINTITN